MGGGERGGEHSLTVLLRSPSSSCARRGFLLDSPRLELAPLPPRGRDRDTEAERERGGEGVARGGREIPCASNRDVATKER